METKVLYLLLFSTQTCKVAAKAEFWLADWNNSMTSVMQFFFFSSNPNAPFSLVSELVT